MNFTLAQLEGYARAMDAADRRDMLNAALAARAALAEQKDFKKLTKELGGDG